MKNYRIGILGMGGVGGYLGAKLGKAKLPGIELIFIARTQTKEVLTNDGLKLITDDGEFITYAQIVSDDPVTIGRLDLLICTVKFNDLADSLQRYSACVDKNSIILPLLNGIDVAKEVRKILPGIPVWKACIYIVARQEGHGVIRQTGAMKQIYFGSENATSDQLNLLENIFKQAGIKADISGNMDAELWKKFFFISVLGTVTSYYNSAIGIVQKDARRLMEIRKMVDELEQIANAKRINLPPGLAQVTYDRILALDPGTTSSMYADFQKDGTTELEELTGEVIRLGKEFNIPTPVYDQMYQELLR